ncbi:CvpA family protein [Rhodoferax sp. PAMC 29310]|uniref:CvpA family protein n=1 Tax=Rhodoferax sp. PAMC 29310 TaxID=2822760 RepID=UPI001B32D02F|nr:CvpA family protein [Rhodoferax sp. PAMC 29310]
MGLFALDIIFGTILVVSLLLGIWRGLVYEVLSMVNWVLAFVLAQWLAHDVALKLPMEGAAEGIRYAAGFALVFILAVFAGGLVAALVKKLLSAVGLQPVDRALGAAFGLARGVVMVLAATVVIGMSPLKFGAWWQDSVGAGISLAALKGLKPVLPEEFGKYLPS